MSSIDKMKIEASKVFMWGWVIEFCILMNIPMDNFGGDGLNLPINNVSWSFCFLLMACSWFIIKKSIIFTEVFKWLLLGVVLMTFPALWTHSRDALLFATPRILGLWSGLFLYFTTTQIVFNEKSVLFLFRAISLSSFIVVLFILFEYGVPQMLPKGMQLLLSQYGCHAMGIFQQANVTSTYIATGLASSLFLVSYEKTTWRYGKETILIFLCVIVICDIATLILLQSRVGWIGGGGVLVIIMLVAYLRPFGYVVMKERQKIMMYISLAGIVIGFFILNKNAMQVIHEHDSSTVHRWLAIVNSIKMIMIHPVKGWGLGTFEGAYQLWMSNLKPSNPSREIMNHPHNEVLLLWFEGGIVALLGAGGVLRAFYLLKLRCNNIWSLMCLICIIPIALHTQTEYPFIYSVPHFFVVILLMAFSESCNKTRCSGMNVSWQFFYRTPWVNGMFGMLCLYGFIMMTWSYSANNILNDFEYNPIKNESYIANISVPWFVQYRYENDLNLLKLIDYKKNKDVRLLWDFVRQNGIWLGVHADPELYKNQIQVYKYLGDVKKSNEWVYKANLTFPWETQDFN